MDYVKMILFAKSDHGTCNFVSETLSYTEAVHFAEVFHHNYKAHTDVRQSYEPEMYVVFAYDVEMALVFSNYQAAKDYYEFANWKYITR